MEFFRSLSEIEKKTTDNSYNIFLFGGLTEMGPVNDIWVFQSHNIRWYEVEADGLKLPKMKGHSVTVYYDPISKLDVVLIFGGL
jgi:hypothetical protein